MVLIEQVVLIASILVTFGVCLATTKFAARLFPNFEPLQFYDAATDPMELNVVLAFLVGLVLSVTALLYFDARKLKPVLNPTQWQQYRLMEKEKLSENTALYRFKLSRANNILGLPIGQHISVKATIDGKDVQRSYTPTSSDDDHGFFDLVVKSYEKGNVSKYIGAMKIGDLLSVKGPKGQMRYGPGLCRHIGMIAGGTGLTPCLQIIRAALKNPKDDTKIDFIYANVNVSDILLKNELDELAEKHKDQFRVHYFVNEAPDGWKGGVGFVTKEAVEEFMPKPADDIKILYCGPPPMRDAVLKHLDALGYEKPRSVSKLEDQVFCF
ncbi:Oxidoreductase FAD/NAD(P)-binding [Kalmanozyma brasiliensis GHG001]|uniref:NADH-cytochrome b5 reductase n=1 Tax=Kalmanozyma brasiliensis (strain GHG001) TaxID=1365824 RepID=V5EU14_KALBG|nr:Oxidoreductase FAD/NAD(P)-binding [Kalmanozyma brasiliensis GHG001]EST06578.1 Oxidoreductase FAD/NAD(P)-binding [Kalmanozyma brasiliensis GHG001]